MHEVTFVLQALGRTVYFALPHHYAFHSDFLGDRMITKGDQDPRHYTDALARIARSRTSGSYCPVSR